MAHYTAVVPSSMPAQVAYDFLADFVSIAEWDPGVVEAALVAGTTAQVGARYRVVTRFLGWSTPLVYEVVATSREDDGALRIDLRAENGDFVSFDVITVRPTPSGSEVTYDADLALKGFRRPFDPALRIAFQIIGGRAEAGLRRAVNPRTVSA